MAARRSGQLRLPPILHICPCLCVYPFSSGNRTLADKKLHNRRDRSTSKYCKLSPAIWRLLSLPATIYICIITPSVPLVSVIACPCPPHCNPQEGEGEAHHHLIKLEVNISSILMGAAREKLSQLKVHLASRGR